MAGVKGRSGGYRPGAGRPRLTEEEKARRNRMRESNNEAAKRTRQLVKDYALSRINKEIKRDSKIDADYAVDMAKLDLQEYNCVGELATSIWKAAHLIESICEDIRYSRKCAAAKDSLAYAARILGKQVGDMNLTVPLVETKLLHLQTKRLSKLLRTGLKNESSKDTD